MKQLIFFFSFLFFSAYCVAQKNFIINKGSEKYTASITVENCDSTLCEGKGVISLIDKKTNQVVQTLISDDLFFFLDFTQNPTVNISELYGEQSPLVFGDFNFDGSEDLAIRNGNNGPYDSPTFNVYVYNRTRKQFVLSKELTALVEESLGMFAVDRKRKRLVTYSKSGCCWHLTAEHEIIPNKGLRKVYELEEDAMSGETVIVTTRKLIKNKWIANVKKYKIEEYYKE